MSVDILVERVEPTPVMPSIEVMTEVVSKFLGDSSTQQMGETPRDVSTMKITLCRNPTIRSGYTIKESSCSPMWANLATDSSQTTLMPSSSSFCKKIASRTDVAFPFKTRRSA